MQLCGRKLLQKRIGRPDRTRLVLRRRSQIGSGFNCTDQVLRILPAATNRRHHPVLSQPRDPNAVLESPPVPFQENFLEEDSLQATGELASAVNEFHLQPAIRVHSVCHELTADRPRTRVIHCSAGQIQSRSDQIVLAQRTLLPVPVMVY